MAEVFLHYSGLGPKQHTWFYNRRGAFVHVYPGEWVRLDLDRHPEVQHSIKTGVAVAEAEAPDGIEILDDGTYSGGRYRSPTRSEAPGRRRGLSRSAGLPQALQLSEQQINRLAQCFIAPDDPLKLGIGFVQDYPNGRGPKPDVPNLAPAMHPAFVKNFAVLCRLAELLARKVPPDPIPGAGTRRRQRIAAILKGWGVWEKTAPPPPATLHRYRMRLGLTREQLDDRILSRLPTTCKKCRCAGPQPTGSNSSVPCHRWDRNVVCPHCDSELLPRHTFVLFL